MVKREEKYIIIIIIIFREAHENVTSQWFLKGDDEIPGGREALRGGLLNAKAKQTARKRIVGEVLLTCYGLPATGYRLQWGQ